MNIAFVVIGEEIISGLTEEKNFKKVASELYDLGFSLYLQVVGDRKEDIKFALDKAEKFADFIICSGGLGSTSDDITRKVASEYFSLPLKQYDQAVESMKKRLEERFGRKYDDIPDYLKIQCSFPAGAEIIPNTKGSAFGFKIKKGEKIFYFLPGVPFEFSAMFDEFVLEDIKKAFPNAFKYEKVVFKIFGLTETQIENYVEQIGIPDSVVRISYFPSFPEVMLRIIGKKQQSFFEFIEKVKDTVGNFIYSDDVNKSFKDVVSDFLKKSGLFISVAESFTGGELSNMITDVAGSSSYFRGGEIVYTADAKISLGVSKDVIERFGTVSHECARELARAAKSKFKSDIGLSTTGVAGPDKLEGKNPGLFYIGIAYPDDRVESFEFFFNIGRKNLKVLGAYLALKIVLDFLKKTDGK
jgi:nicotinamide-nucleotide amidase